MGTYAKQVDFLLLPQINPDTGSVYSSGYVKVLLAGTSTEATVYSARDKGGTFTNPFALDADGTKEAFLDDVVDIEIYEGNPATTGVKKETLSGLDYRGVLGLSVATKADLKGITGTAGETVVMEGYSSSGDGGFGLFYWDGSDLSTEVASDAQEGFYVAPTSDATGASGAWVRQYTGQVNVRWFGATGDGSTDDTTAVQACLDTAPINSTVYFPKGTYKVVGTGTAAITLTRKVNLTGDASRGTFIKGVYSDATRSVFEVAFSDNGSFTDVRNWYMENMYIDYVGTALNALHINGGLNILTSRISNMNLRGDNSSTGYSLKITDNWAHSVVEGCTLNSGVYVDNGGDANVFQDNLSLSPSAGPAYTLDMGLGVKNTTIRDNTIVDRDGALHIKNGDAVRFINNQVEQSLAYGENQSTPSASVYLEGSTRTVKNCVIENNNFGGGTNVDYSIYIDNAQHAVISKNYFVASDADDIYLTANSKYCIYDFDNTVQTQVSNPRTDNIFKAQINNNSGYNIQMPISVTMANSWVNDGVVYKDKLGWVRNTDTFSGGTSTAGTVVCTFPAGSRPTRTIDYLRLSGNTTTVAAHHAAKVTAANGEMELLTDPTSTGFTFEPFQSPVSSTDF